MVECRNLIFSWKLTYDWAARSTKSCRPGLEPRRATRTLVGCGSLSDVVMRRRARDAAAASRPGDASCGPEPAARPDSDAGLHALSCDASAVGGSAVPVARSSSLLDSVPADACVDMPPGAAEDARLEGWPSAGADARVDGAWWVVEGAASESASDSLTARPEKCRGSDEHQRMSWGNDCFRERVL
jgi:hypothetical protein